VHLIYVLFIFFQTCFKSLRIHDPALVRRNLWLCPHPIPLHLVKEITKQEIRWGVRDTVSVGAPSQCMPLPIRPAPELGCKYTFLSVLISAALAELVITDRPGHDVDTFLKKQACVVLSRSISLHFDGSSNLAWTPPVQIWRGRREVGPDPVKMQCMFKLKKSAVI
jgi:hypothetical protein